MPAAAATAATADDEAADDEDHIRLEMARSERLGDLDMMIEQRRIRVLVPYSKTFYFIDKGTERGLMYEMMKKFGDSVNKKHKLTKLPVTTVFIPTSRDQMLADLKAGRGDVIAANITVTPARAEQVDFSAPLATDVKEVVVSSAEAPAIATLDDLSGKQVFVRRGSIYFDNLNAVNADFKKRGKQPIVLRDAPPTFEDEDILEMINAGLADYTVVDRYLARFWNQVYPAMKVHEDIVVSDGADIAFAFRKDSPKLKAEMDAFVKTSAQGTTFGNVVINKYLRDTRWVKNATTEEEMRKFNELAQIFRKYAGQYDVDWVLMVAQGYQESRLDQKVKSKVGAIGVMQLMPATGKQMQVGDVSQVESNIHAGIKYIRHLIDEYYKDEPMDDLNKALFAFAAYNAGPGRIRSMRSLAAKRGLDPNKWFNNVERVVSEKVGREPVQYVANIYKYYVAYTLALEQRERKD